MRRERGKYKGKEKKRERDDALVVNSVGKNERQKIRSELTYES